MSITTPPPASGTSSRQVVVWRPRSSAARIGAVARSPPVSALSSVVLPTPEAPSSTPVTPGPSSAASASSPVPVDGRDRQHRRGAAQRGAHLGHVRGRVRHEVGLGQHDHRLGRRVGGEREHALDAAEVELAGERGHDDDEVDVGGEDLRLAAVARRAHERGRALAHGVDRARLGVAGDPVADRGQVGGRPRRGAAGR